MKLHLSNRNQQAFTALLFCASVFAYPSTVQAAQENSFVQNIQQQKQTVSGIVVDTSGLEVIGVSILEKGTNNGIITDIEGKFTLQVNPGATIIVSFIGYVTQELKATPGQPMKIILKEDNQILDEVVVVGFGTQKKVNLTGSVGTISADEIASRPVTNAAQALQGLVPGLQISQSGGSLETNPSINVRGKTTIGKGSSGDPLILIDGMEGDINSINPQDIENISILKDASASSIYGSRAPFGVILITTKSGKAGKTTVNYNNNFRIGTPILMPEMMDSYTFATYFNAAGVNGKEEGHFKPEHLQRIKDYQTGKITESIIPAPNGQYWADGYAEGNDNIDWYDAVYKKHNFSHEHNLSVNGGTEKLGIYASVNYLNQEGLMKWGEEGYQRFTSTAKLSAELAKWARISYNVRFTRVDYKRPSALTDNLYDNLGRQGWPTLPLYDPNGYLYSSPSPVLGLATGGTDKTQTDNLYQQFSLILEPIQHWVTHVDVNYRIKSANRHWDSQQTFNHDVNGNPYLYSSSSNVHEDYLKENYFNINAFSEYNFSLFDDHNFKIMVGFQAENFIQKKFGLQREGIMIPSLPEVDTSTGMGPDGNPVTPATNGASAEWSTAGFFGRLNYDYKGRYLLEANVRYDGTSRFRKDQRWNVFPSFSVGWNVAHEAFWENWVDVINSLKLRASYGELGNQNTKEWYPTYQILSVKASDGQWLQNGIKPNTATVPALVSSTLDWEKVKSWNVGFDFGAFSNRLTGSFDWYIRKTLNMVGPAPQLPVILGIDVPITNNTDLKTYGWELELSWNDRLHNGLGYGIRFTLADAQTKITNYPNANKTLSNNSDSFYSGQKLGEIWGYETIGIAKSNEEMKAHLENLDRNYEKFHGKAPATPLMGQNAIGNTWEAGDIMYRDLNGDGVINDGSFTLDNHGDKRVNR
ncbi:TonB-dependent Receptor Plug domain-containing protein [gut metagenome]|uniref:TonB-dependent Receptor Plug domain-containing protein n=1 Tax=gut metagenome TaxID=749906 RepID=J9C6Y3_9ZZZZ